MAASNIVGGPIQVAGPITVGAPPLGDDGQDPGVVDVRERLSYLFGPVSEPYRVKQGAKTNSIQLPDIYKGSLVLVK